MGIASPERSPGLRRSSHPSRTCSAELHADRSLRLLPQIKRRAGSSTRAVSLQKKPPVLDTAQAVRNRGLLHLCLVQNLRSAGLFPRSGSTFKPQSSSGILGPLLFRRQRMPGGRFFPPAEKTTALLQQGLHEMKPEHSDHEHCDQNQEKRTDCSQRHGNHLTSWQSCSGRTV